ncbi:hypothetical protein JOB18_018105 [Solea senegalensis]|uniref:DM10 domain-containing protein n=1 Tax=Solea senegalensis TaxID=28829 RepID=A0AAV6RA99_SOLSE|nr:EF-hand domain-containing family member C2 [Solea senegalensis]KAG7502356.1 hypothetical protein JOB18_018105 [Solea senegalensis]
MSLPFLPGLSSNKHLWKEKFHKSQHFDVSNGVSMMVGSDKPGIGGEPLSGHNIKPKYSVYPRGRGSQLPPWVAFDKQVLCFEAFFEQTVPQSREENLRIRKCRIFFFPEDDTIKVVEPHVKNSGIPQGTLLRRQRVPLPPPNQQLFYTVYHLNLDQQVELYSHTFTITSCDAFTRKFLTRLGVQLNEPTSAPDDPYTHLRQQMEDSMNPLRPYERQDTLRQFVDNDRVVLRFFCVWDDAESEAGELRELVLNYFLSDDTVEIRHVHAPNSGRDHVSKFLRRCRLPKNCVSTVKQPGQITQRTVLNVIDSQTRGKRFILDNLKTGAEDEEFYKDRDFTVGGEINVFGRRIVITDCDDFTKHFYRSKYAIDDFTPVPYKAPVAPPAPRAPPPYTGFGSEEDSLSWCQSLVPKAPHKDLRKFMEKDRRGLDSNVLSFRARMETNDPADAEREFVVSFYLSDDSIGVFERAQRNSGVVGGKFLERGRVKKPGQDPFQSDPFEYLTAQDLFVGATLCLNKHHFRLLEADDYTCNYMERHHDEFPKSNVSNILSKLRSLPVEKQSEMKKFLTLSDPNNTGVIPYHCFRNLLLGLDCGLSEHEVLVLGRSVRECDQSEDDVALVLAVVQDLLRKKLFEDFHHMTRACTHRDRHRSGRLSTSEMRTVCKSCRLPLPESLLSALIHSFSVTDEIDFHAFIAAINWLENPAPAVTPDLCTKFEVNMRTDSGADVVKNINYSSLLGDVVSLPSDNSNTTTTTTTTTTADASE